MREASPVLRRIVVLAVAVVVSTALLVPVAAPAQAQLAPDAPWLEVVDFYRASAGLPPVSPNGAWSEGAFLHSRYMAQQGFIAHGQDPANPWFTPQGELAGRDSNIGPGAADWTDRGFIESFMIAPFHAFGMLRPGWQTTGYGSYRDLAAPLTAAATLDVIRGLDVRIRQTQPIVWPGNGVTVPLTSFDLETPDPLFTCGWTSPAGLPIVVLLPEEPGPTSATVVQGDRALPVCVVTKDTFTHPNPQWLEVGRTLLDIDDAVVVIPRDPLDPGAAFQVTVRTSTRRIEWSFATSTPEPFHPVPEAVGDLRATVEGPAVRLDWTPVAGAAAYDVVRDGTVLTRVGGPPWTDGAAPQGRAASYQVIAVGPLFDRQREPSGAVVVVPGDAAAVVDDGRDGSPFVTLEAFIGRQHRDLLGRVPDAFWLSMWTKQVRMGLVRQPEVVGRLLRSSGFGMLAGPLVRTHMAVTGSVPEGLWLRNGLEARRAGTPLPAIVDELLGSEAGQARFGGTDDATFVATLYELVLGRGADPGGTAYWAGLLADGRLSRGAVVAAFTESAEHVIGTWRTVEVTIAFAGLLGRTPDPEGLAYWREAGGSLEELGWALIQSPEYAGRFQPVA